jgi:virulence-associated protein VagC
MTPHLIDAFPIGYASDGAMTSSTVFTSNRSQFVRLPKAVAFPEDVHQVDILKIGRSRVIVPQGKRGTTCFRAARARARISWPNVSSRRPRSEQQPVGRIEPKA